MGSAESFQERRKGLYKEVSLPVYGSQDVGVTPGGVMDQFAFDCGNALLGNEADAPALEMIIPPVLAVKADLYFVLTGAPLRNAKTTIDGHAAEVEHGVVCFARTGTEISFGARRSGLRSYLCFRPAGPGVVPAEMGSRRLSDVLHGSSWPDKEKYIRVVEGPEHGYLENPGDFFGADWKVGRDTSDMGMRIESSVVLTVNLGNMISQPVTSGTVQLTPGGPIILLKHRQTVGGYPRIFAVISADVDLLAQYMPGNTIRFKKVTLEEARLTARRKREDIISLRERFNSQ